MKKKSMPKDNFSIKSNDESTEEFNGLIEDSINNIPQGNIMSSFNFAEELSPSESLIIKQSTDPELNRTTTYGLVDNRKTKAEANVVTKSVDGEAYSISRFYKLRYSTAKMLNEIKASHSNVNVYMNTIVDEAIRYYYSSLR